MELMEQMETKVKNIRRMQGEVMKNGTNGTKWNTFAMYKAHIKGERIKQMELMEQMEPMEQARMQKVKQVQWN